MELFFKVCYFFLIYWTIADWFAGRAAMVTDAANVSKKALTIAIRYAAVRRQFKVGHKEVSNFWLWEWFITDFQLSSNLKFLITQFTKEDYYQF